MASSQWVEVLWAFLCFLPILYSGLIKWGGRWFRGLAAAEPHESVFQKVLSRHTLAHPELVFPSAQEHFHSAPPQPLGPFTEGSNASGRDLQWRKLPLTGQVTSDPDLSISIGQPGQGRPRPCPAPRRSGSGCSGCSCAHPGVLRLLKIRDLGLASKEVLAGQRNLDRTEQRKVAVEKVVGSHKKPDRKGREGLAEEPKLV